MLDYISRQLGQLDIVQKLPDAGVPSDQLANRAMDVLSASLKYLAVHIHRESARLGIIGNIGSTIIKGDDECQSVDTEFKFSVSEFNSALVHFGQSITFRTFEVLEGTIPSSNDISLLSRSPTGC
jgi:hypothetical protein